MFHRKAGMKKKVKQISKDMISLPQPDFIHPFPFGIKNEPVQVESNSIEPTLSLLDDVMQAFAEIYSETEIDPDTTIIEIENQSASLSQLLSKLTIQTSPEISSRFTRELEEHSRNDLSEQNKHTHSLLINRCTSKSFSSISSNPEKSDSHSHSSSISSLNSRSSSITGQPLPPPPDLLTLGNKLTTASSTLNIQLPDALKSTKSRMKKRFHFFA